MADEDYGFAFIEVHISRGELTLIREIELFRTRADGEAFVTAASGEFQFRTTPGWGAVDFRLVHIDGEDYRVLDGEMPLVHVGIESSPQILRKTRI